MNKVILSGRLATDPEIKYTPSGVPVTNFRLAVQDSYRNADGERDTHFFDIVAWRGSAEFCANYLNTGRLVEIDGRLRVREWAAQDGSKRRTVEVHVNEIRALDSAKGSASHDVEETPHHEPLPAQHTTNNRRNTNKPQPVTAGVANYGPTTPEFEDPFADE